MQRHRLSSSLAFRTRRLKRRLLGPVLTVAERAGIDPRRAYARRAHLARYGSLPNLRNPKTFHESLIARSLNDRSPSLPVMADKAAARDYVAERVGAHVLIDVLHIGRDLDAYVPTDDAVAIKATHGSGSDWMRLVTDPTTADWDQLREVARRWATTPLAPGSYEWWYEEIPPQVIVERFLGDPLAGPPADYKLWVFDGSVELIQVDSDRLGDHRQDLHRPDWERLDAVYRYPRSDVPVDPPAHLAEMLDIAATLGDGLPFVRVDLYDTEDGVRFGELTHCPWGGLQDVSDPALSRRFARLMR